MDELLDEARALDATLSALGLTLWMGAEPTFTRRDSQEPEWLSYAEGGDKEARARALLLALAPRLAPGVVLTRVVGRHFPGEPRPRFAFGARWPRDAGTGGTPAPCDLAGLDAAPQPPPALDPDVAWLTVTPDPGVVEVNLAPAPDLATFALWTRAVYAAAREAGLSAVRYRYNGEVVDSGGGGQITLGGPGFARSPFFLHPHLLPSLLRYFNHHPSLSDWFADCVGSASQGPRPDEGVRERFEELGLALDLLDAHTGALGPEALWSALAPLLVDCSGNSHRAEINVEKLCNPYLGERGRMGVVELRSLRMPASPNEMVGVGALTRALVARLFVSPFREPIVDWGSALHDRFALPTLLREDLAEVLEDLASHGVGLGPRTTSLLLAPARPEIASVESGGATLAVSPAWEFWPLVGDVASQERAGARVVDSSTARIEILVRVPAGLDPGRVAAHGREVPLTALGIEDGAERYAAGVRYRLFEPQPGFHPGLAAQDPLVLLWQRGAETVSLALHGWIPGGGVYDGLPAGVEEAERRRRQRVVVERPARWDARPAPLARGFTIDVRG
jgi:uncharacterized protein (DUF2126 family)